MKPHKDEIIRTALYNGFLLEIHYKAGLIISTRLVQSNGFDSTPNLVPYEHIDVCKLDSSRVSVFRWRVYQLLMDRIQKRQSSHMVKSLSHSVQGLFGAVGTALSNNPWPIIVPCHRVV